MFNFICYSGNMNAEELCNCVLTWCRQTMHCQFFKYIIKKSLYGAETPEIYSISSALAQFISASRWFISHLLANALDKRTCMVSICQPLILFLQVHFPHACP